MTATETETETETEAKDSFTVKAKRTEHPNAAKYPGRPSLEFGSAIRAFLGELSYPEQDKLLAGTLVVEEEDSTEFYDSIEVGDIVGVGLWRGLNEQGENEHNEPAAYKFEITSIDGDMMQARNVTIESRMKKRNSDYKGDETELAYEDLSCALGTGYGEILERDGKPFGVSEEIEYTVRIVGPKEEEVEVKTSTSPLPATSTAPDIEDDEEEDDDFSKLCKLPASELIFAMVDPPDDNLFGELCFVITPAKTFYEEGCWCDQFQANDNIDDIVDGMMESVFEPGGDTPLSMKEVREELLKRGLVEEPDLIKNL